MEKRLKQQHPESIGRIARRARKRLKAAGKPIPGWMSQERLIQYANDVGMDLKPGPSQTPSKKRKPPKWHQGFYGTREWAQVRYRALRASEGKCMCCGRGAKENAVLNVDHIKPRHKYPELALSVANLQVLCADCNKGKGGWDETDWRPEPVHAPDCDWHYEQYPWECTCGVTAHRQGRDGT